MGEFAGCGMLALTIKQPWASLIIHHGKDIENRTWPTKVRGRIAVHSSGRLEAREIQLAVEVAWKLKPSSLQTSALNAIGRAPRDIGVIIGTVEIVDCVVWANSPWFSGPYGFVLRDPIILPEPIPFKGALGFWKVPDGLIEALCGIPAGDPAAKDAEVRR